MKKTVVPLLVAVALLCSVSAVAHHGTAGTYDQTKVVKVSGVVTQFVWRQPHCILVLSGKDESGKDVNYSFEIGGPGGLVKQGFSRDTFKPGDTVSLDMHPSFNNPHVGQPSSKAFVINGTPVTGIPGGDE